MNDSGLIPLNEFSDIEQLRCIVKGLFQIIDDIDTVSDVAKIDDEWYRSRVERLQKHRFKFVSTDGYELFIKNTEAAESCNESM